AALQEAINTPETNQPLTTTPPVKTRKNARKAVTRKVVSTTTKPPMPIAIPTGRKNTNLTKELMKEVKRLNKAGYTDAQIGTSLGIKPATAKYARLKLGLRGHPGNPGSRKKTSATPASTIDNTPATETTALTTT